MIKERINSLRSLFEEHGIDSYIVPSNDKYMSEYVSEYAKRLEYITGFTGSNGIAVICKDVVLFFTDGRYLAQACKQLDLELFKIFDLKDVSKFDWEDYLSRAGYDPELFTYQAIKNLIVLDPVDKPRDDNLQKINGNLIDKIWQNQPLEPNTQVYLHDIQFAGISHIEKINKCRDMSSRGFLTRSSNNNCFLDPVDDLWGGTEEYSLVILDISSICWLLNMRASDVAYTPLMFSKVIITSKKVYLFINPARINAEIIKERPEITILPEEEFENILRDQDNIFIDDSIASIYIMNLIESKKVHKTKDPCLILKACKNEVEIKHAIDFHIKDAVALCEFFAYVIPRSSHGMTTEVFTEYTLGLKLIEYRTKQEGYVSDSFPVICGFRENSAIIHYKADPEAAKKIEGQGILLIDSGGQYKGATTDITRTITIGYPNDEQKKRYTQVLKGHIALAKAKFPKNIITGANLDILARQYLWQDEQDYPHGTGHGVGSFLSVHEGPQSISLRNKTILQDGMILSNEPGFYIPGEYGIRIENLIYVKENNGWLEFDTLSLVPYAKELIDVKLLNNDEISYIKHYYQKMKIQIHHLLSPTAKVWLDNEINILL